MIYRVKDSYVISSHHCWLPGTYTDERAAKYAFRFTNEQLAALHDKKARQDITFEDLGTLRRSLS